MRMNVPGDHTETGRFIICLTRKIINGKQEREMSEIASALKTGYRFVFPAGERRKYFASGCTRR